MPEDTVTDHAACFYKGGGSYTFLLSLALHKYDPDRKVPVAVKVIFVVMILCLAVRLIL